jgi:hypothetical protein
MSAMGCADREPRYLFLRSRQNRNGQPYAAANLHAILGRLRDGSRSLIARADKVLISKTHRFRHTSATHLLNAGVLLHVVMRYFGHLTPEMTMHCAVTLSQTAEREMLRFKKITAHGRPLPIEQGDLYEVPQLDQRADRVLPNGWYMLPPKQVCNRGNACLSCDKFVTDASHGPELRRQLTDTERLVDQRKAAFLTNGRRERLVAGTPDRGQLAAPDPALYRRCQRYSAGCARCRRQRMKPTAEQHHKGGGCGMTEHLVQCHFSRSPPPTWYSLTTGDASSSTTAIRALSTQMQEQRRRHRDEVDARCRTPWLPLMARTSNSDDDWPNWTTDLS